MYIYISEHLNAILYLEISCFLANKRWEFFFYILFEENKMQILNEKQIIFWQCLSFKLFDLTFILCLFLSSTFSYKSNIKICIWSLTICKYNSFLLSYAVFNNPDLLMRARSRSHLQPLRKIKIPISTMRLRIEQRNLCFYYLNSFK